MMNGRDVREVVRTAFDRAPELQPDPVFADRLRDQLRREAASGRRSSAPLRRWLGLAAGMALAAGVAAAVLSNRWTAPADALARDAIGDHRNCALKYRLIRTPVPLEEAAERFDRSYRVLISVPPDDFSTPEGPAHVVERHSCAFGGRRFGHVILQYRGRVVSLLVTAGDGSAARYGGVPAAPHVIGQSVDGLSVVSVSGSRHDVVLVGDLENRELTQLAGIVSAPLVERLGDLAPGRTVQVAWVLATPAQALTPVISTLSR